MALTDRQWQVAQSWIGTVEARDLFTDRYMGLGEDLDKAILESLRAQLSKLNGQPGSLSLPSGLSISVGENLRAFQSIMKDFADGGTAEALAGTRYYRRVRPDLR